MNRLLVHAASACLLTLSACGGERALRASITGPADADVTPASSLPADAGSPDAEPSDADLADIETDADDDAALPATNLGDVFLQSGFYDGGASESFQVQAVFYSVVATTGCALSQAANCVVTDCAYLATPPTLASAGTIKVTGGLFPFFLPEITTGDYALTGTLPLFHGGESLQIASSGETVPSFTAQLRAPAQVTVLTPPLAAGTLTVPRGEPFGLSWFGASAGDVVVTVATGAPTSRPYHAVSCSFDATASSATIPAEVFAPFPQGSGILRVATQVKTHVSAGGWLIAAFATAGANDAQGAEYVQPLVFP